jgi:hypothetical protein
MYKRTYFLRFTLFEISVFVFVWCYIQELQNYPGQPVQQFLGWVKLHFPRWSIKIRWRMSQNSANEIINIWLLHYIDNWNIWFSFIFNEFSWSSYNSSVIGEYLHRYAQSQHNWKPNNFKIIRSKKTIGSKQNSHNRLWSPMPEGGVH